MVFTSVWFTLGFNDAWLIQDIGDSVFFCHLLNSD